MITNLEKKTAPLFIILIFMTPSFPFNFIASGMLYYLTYIWEKEVIFKEV